MHAAIVLVLLVSIYIVEAASFSASKSTGLSKKSWMGRKKSLKSKNDEDLDEIVKKQGLEVGIFKSFSSNKIKPQDLLAKYGAAYLVTSISLAIVSYAICYTLVSNGIDMSALLNKVGIEVSDASSTAGTAGIAYVFHKAASPIRFPPTVALTPIVASWLGKSSTDENPTN